MTQCLGITLKGERCKKMLSDGNYCHLHISQNTKSKKISQPKILINPDISEKYILKVLKDYIVRPFGKDKKKKQIQWALDEETLNKFYKILNKLYHKIISINVISEENIQKSIKENVPKNIITKYNNEPVNYRHLKFFSKDKKNPFYELTRIMENITRTILELTVERFENNSVKVVFDNKVYLPKKDLMNVIKNTDFNFLLD